MSRSLARTAFFLSGVAGLTFEILWTRYLALAMGATTIAVATTTAVYMGGLALGSHLGGRWADRMRRPLAVYGALEIGIAAYALLVPLMFSQISSVDAALFGGMASVWSRALVRFFVAALMLVIPTTLMGMTLPILARAVTDDLTHVGREVGALYAINIAGATCGAAAAGFWWIPAVGLSATNGIGVGIDAVLGVVALCGGLVLAPTGEPAPAIARKSADLLRIGSRPLVVMLAVTGAAAMALQVLWTRALATALGPSTYAFSAIVCTYLAGLAIGGAVASRLSDRVHATRMVLSVVLLVTGLLTLTGINLVDDLPLMLQSVVLDKDLTVEGLIRTDFFLAAISVLPATIGMGTIFPLTIAAVVGSKERLGGAVGRAYAVNTLGAIGGSFAGVFILLPLLGVEGGMRAAAMGYIGLAALMSLRLESTVKPATQGRLWAAVAVAAVLIVAWPGWNVGHWTFGLYRLSMTRTYFDHTDIEPADVIFHADGFASTVTVEENDGTLWIKVDGKIDGSSEGDMPTQVLSGMLPMLLHPDPNVAAVIGCGSCVTVGAALQTDVERLTLIELEQEVVEAAHLFSDVNHAPWTDPRLTIVADDGRNYLRRTRETFDVIISEPSNPWMTGAASLFTLEFFQLAQRRLADDGMFLQWLQIYELAPERIASVLVTFNTVFDHMLVFSAHPDSNDLLLLGSRRPIVIDWEQLGQRFAAYREELDRAELASPAALVALLLFTDVEMATLPEDIELNTDDNALIEFGAPKDLLVFASKDPDLPLLEHKAGERWELLRRQVPVDEVHWPRRAIAYAEGYLQQGMIEDSIGVATQALLSDEVTAEAEELIDLASLLDEPDRQAVLVADTVRSDPEYALAAKRMVDEDDAGALAVFSTVEDLEKRSPAHQLLYGYLLYRDEQYVGARLALSRARGKASDPEHHPSIAYYLARGAFGAGEYDRAIEQMRQFRALQKRPLSESRGAD